MPFCVPRWQHGAGPILGGLGAFIKLERVAASSRQRKRGADGIVPFRFKESALLIQMPLKFNLLFNDPHPS
jgi:hypothetical protein